MTMSCCKGACVPTGFSGFLSVAIVAGLYGCGGGGNGSAGGSLPPDTSLPAPSNVIVLPGDEQLGLSWPEVPDASGYNIYLSEFAGIHANTAASYSAMQSVNTTSHAFTELMNGTRYHLIVTATAGSVESEASDEVSATPAAPAPFNPTTRLNDTGIDWCADSVAAVAIEGATVEKRTGCQDLAVSYPRQDAHSGRDAQFRDGQLPKRGGGSAGFDFSKISNSGAVVGF